MPKFTIIVAMDQNRIIGKNNQLPWPKIKEDLNHFKKTTNGKAIIMGRKTYESIGKALPNRKNYVLSSQNLNEPEIILVKNLNEALELPEQEIFVIGGSQIYELFLPLANKIIVSKIPFSVDGDSRFPIIDLKNWKLESSQKINLADFDNQIMQVDTLVRSD